MTDKDYVRIFFAIDFSKLEKIKIINELNLTKNKFNQSGFRWTRREHLHVTLQFLAKMRKADIKALGNSVRKQVIGSISPFYLQLGPVSFLPDTTTPKTMVIHIVQSKELTQLSHLVGLGIKNIGYDIDDRPFYAHVTIARFANKKCPLDFLSGLDWSHFMPIYVHSVTLFQSESSGDESTYTILDQFDMIP